MISKCCEKSKDWDKQLPYLLFAYRANVQDSTKESPFFLLYGRDPRIPSESALNCPATPYMVDLDDYKSELTSNLTDAWEIARANIQEAQAHQKHQYDKHSKESKLSIGDRVMVYMPQSVSGKAWKLARPFYGPYRVLSLTPTNAEVKLIDKPDSESIFVALNRVRLCYPELPSKSWSGQKPKRTPVKKSKQTTVTTTPVPERTTGPVTRSMSKHAAQIQTQTT